ncbi:lasso RiPP family leader peptide-containing protein [Streptomyces sp. ET3-23]|nr:keywimysin-related RiPP [Streptomyces sp. ET3-23]MCC2278749.1 lasso RiPP family leader peptide-containing protein [Streptomyces sp. ET3-23]
MKQAYETPMLVAMGEFREITGLLGLRGNDELVLDKHV